MVQRAKIIQRLMSALAIVEGLRFRFIPSLKGLALGALIESFILHTPRRS